MTTLDQFCCFSCNLVVFFVCLFLQYITTTLDKFSCFCYNLVFCFVVFFSTSWQHWISFLAFATTWWFFCCCLFFPEVHNNNTGSVFLLFLQLGFLLLLGSPPPPLQHIMTTLDQFSLISYNLMFFVFFPSVHNNNIGSVFSLRLHLGQGSWWRASAVLEQQSFAPGLPCTDQEIWGTGREHHGVAWILRCWAYFSSVWYVIWERKIYVHSRNSSVVRAPDSCRKVAGSSPCRSGRRIIFSRVDFFVLTLILVSVPSLCCRSSTSKILVMLPKVQVAGYS